MHKLRLLKVYDPLMGGPTLRKGAGWYTVLIVFQKLLMAIITSEKSLEIPPSMIVFSPFLSFSFSVLMADNPVEQMCMLIFINTFMTCTVIIGRPYKSECVCERERECVCVWEGQVASGKGVSEE